MSGISSIDISTLNLGYREVAYEPLSFQPSASGFMTAMELGHQRKRVVRISTGSKQFDAILGGFVHFRCWLLV